MITEATMSLLGYGDCFNDEAGNTAGLIKLIDDKGKKFNILIDCGYDVPPKLDEEEWPDIICITHAHGDHCAGLEQVAFKSKFLLKKKPILICQEEVLSDLAERFYTVLKTAIKVDWDESSLGFTKEDIFDEYFDVEATDICGYTSPLFNCPFCTIKTLKVPHTEGLASSAFKIILFDPKIHIFWSGDTNSTKTICKELDITKYKFDYNWIFHEVTDIKSEVHCYYKELEALGLLISADFLFNESNCFQHNEEDCIKDYILTKIVPIHLSKNICKNLITKLNTINMSWPGPGGVNTKFNLLR